MTIISPGSTSLINSAPTTSRPQDSEEIIQEPSSVLPMQRGLNPCGSRTAINLFSVIIAKQKAPFTCCTLSMIFSSILDLRERAIRLTITSVSIEV